MFVKWISSLLIFWLVLPTFVPQDAQLTPELAVITAENVDSLVEIARIGNGQILDVAWSGQRLAVATTVGVWMVDSLSTPPRLLTGHESLARDAVFNADETLLAAGDESGMLFIWHGISGELLKSFPTGLGAIARVAFSPNGNFVVAGDDSGTVKIFSITRGEVLYQFFTEDVGGLLIDILFSPDGRYLAWNVYIGGGDVSMQWELGNGLWYLIDMQTGQRLLLPQWHVEKYRENFGDSTLFFSEASEPIILTSTTPDGERTFENFWTGEIIEYEEGWLQMQENPFVTTYHGEQQIIDIGEERSALNFYFLDDSSREVPFAVLQHWTQSITHFAIAPNRKVNADSNYYVLISYQYGKAAYGKVELWDVSPESISLISRTSLPFYITTIAMDTARGFVTFLLGTLDGQVLYFRGEDSDYRVLERHQDSVTGFAFVPDSDFFFSGSMDGTIEFSSGGESRTIYQGEGGIRNLDYYPETQQIIFSVKDYECKIVCNQLLALTLPNPQNEVLMDFAETSLGEGIFSHDRTKFAMLDNTLSLWDVSSAENLGTFWDNEANWERNYTPALYTIAFSPDDHLLVGGYGGAVAMTSSLRDYYGFFKVWDVETQRELITIDAHGERITSVAFSEDGKLIVTASLDGTVRFWGVPQTN